jgi:hypothetical protein
LVEEYNRWLTDFEEWKDGLRRRRRQAAADAIIIQMQAEEALKKRLKNRR